ncbi:MAG: hypothetical protein IJ662_06485 [Clostridia bacterium]|nr:hypothetical protein [Clostridia bacterium]
MDEIKDAIAELENNVFIHQTAQKLRPIAKEYAHDIAVGLVGADDPDKVISETKKLVEIVKKRTRKELDEEARKKKPVTKAEIMSIKDYRERQRLIAENIQLFQQK